MDEVVRSYPLGPLIYDERKETVMNVSICSREQAETLLKNGFPAHTAVISFYDPPSHQLQGTEPLNFSGKAERVFQVALHDIDLSVLPDYGLSYETYLPEAKELAEFVFEAKRDGLDILCQCEYGQSRSAACAAAILEYFDHAGITVFADYRYYPNQLVYQKIFDALTAAKKEKP